MVAKADVQELERRLTTDADFERRFDADPVTTLRDAQLETLAAEVERGLANLALFAERLEDAPELVEHVRTDPVGGFASAGLPAPAVGYLLEAVGADERLVARASTEVQAHTALPPNGRLLVLLATSSYFVFFAQEAFARVLAPLAG